MDRLVRAEQVRTLYRHSTTVLVTAGINAAILAGITAWLYPHWAIAVWGSAILAVSVGRAYLTRTYRHQTIPPSSADHWGRWFAAGSTANGLVWGSAAWALYMPGVPAHHVFLAFVVGGLVAGASATVSAYMPAFLGYTLAAVLPLAVRLSLEGSAVSRAMAAMVVVFGAAQWRVAVIHSRSLAEAFRLRFEKATFAERLADAQTELRETNATLEERVAERTAALDRAGAERERAERELMRIQKIDALGRLTGGIAHDFNNLLTVIRNSYEILEQPDAPDARRETALQAGAAATSRGVQLVRGLMAFSRAQSMHPQATQVHTIITELIDVLLRRVLPENLTIDNRATSPVWDVYVDPALAESALLNLVLNARDAMPDGGTLTLAAENVTVTPDFPDAPSQLPLGDYVRIAVSDTGQGMTEEVLARAVDPFFTTKGVGEGSGLGLSMAYGFATQSGGGIHLRSEPGQGAAVSLYLPRHSAGEREPDVPAVTPETFDGAGRTVLVVEDDESVRTVAGIMLESLGFTIATAETGEAALAQHPTMAGIDIVFSDVVMPGEIDGITLAHRVLEINPDLPVVLTTGYTDRLPPDDSLPWLVIPKPYHLPNLVEAFHEVLTRTPRAGYTPLIRGRPAASDGEPPG